MRGRVATRGSKWLSLAWLSKTAPARQARMMPSAVRAELDSARAKEARATAAPCAITTKNQRTKRKTNQARPRPPCNRPPPEQRGAREREESAQREQGRGAKRGPSSRGMCSERRLRRTAGDGCEIRNHSRKRLDARQGARIENPTARIESQTGREQRGVDASSGFDGEPRQ